MPYMMPPGGDEPVYVPPEQVEARESVGWTITDAPRGSRVPKRGAESSVVPKEPEEPIGFGGLDPAALTEEELMGLYPEGTAFVDPATGAQVMVDPDHYGYWLNEGFVAAEPFYDSGQWMNPPGSHRYVWVPNQQVGAALRGEQVTLDPTQSLGLGSGINQGPVTGRWRQAAGTQPAPGVKEDIEARPDITGFDSFYSVFHTTLALDEDGFPIYNQETGLYERTAESRGFEDLWQTLIERDPQTQTWSTGNTRTGSALDLLLDGTEEQGITRPEYLIDEEGRGSGRRQDPTQRDTGGTGTKGQVVEGESTFGYAAPPRMVREQQAIQDKKDKDFIDKQTKEAEQGTGRTRAPYQGVDDREVDDAIGQLMMNMIGNKDTARIKMLREAYKSAHRKNYDQPGQYTSPAEEVKEVIRGYSEYKTIHKLRPDDIEDDQWLPSYRGALANAGLHQADVGAASIDLATAGASGDAVAGNAEGRQTVAGRRSVALVDRFRDAASAAGRLVR